MEEFQLNNTELDSKAESEINSIDISEHLQTETSLDQILINHESRQPLHLDISDKPVLTASATSEFALSANCFLKGCLWYNFIKTQVVH